MYSKSLAEADRSTERYMVMDMQRQLEKKDELIAQKDASIAEKDAEIGKLQEEINLIKFLLVHFYLYRQQQICILGNTYHYHVLVLIHGDSIFLIHYH